MSPNVLGSPFRPTFCWLDVAAAFLILSVPAASLFDRAASSSPFDAELETSPIERLSPPFSNSLYCVPEKRVWTCQSFFTLLCVHKMIDAELRA